MNQHKKRLNVKPEDVIDASIVLAPVTEDDLGVCQKYLDQLGHNYKGYMTHALAGEVIFNSLKIKDIETRKNFLSFFASLIEQKKIKIIPIKCSHDYVTEAKSCGYVSEDDAVHLSEIKSAKLKNFVTIDEELNKKETKQNIKSKLGIKIKHPEDL